MISDGRKVPDLTVFETDVCIVGTGAAGLTLAREFANSKFRVCVLESGGMEKDSKTQSLYEGQNVGLPHIPLTWPRDRYFGGTTNSWTGQCRPLEPSDFEQRAWIPHSGWPFQKSHLDPYYERAHSVCQLGPQSYRLIDWLFDDLVKIPLKGTGVETVVFQFSPPTRFGKVYEQEVTAAKNTDVYLYSNVIEIETTATGSKSTKLKVATLEGNTFEVKARIFILATGGIENSRLLLLSDSVNPNGLGNQNDLVGRFFMQHLLFISGLIMINRPEISVELYTGGPREHPLHEVPFRGMLSLTEDRRRREKIAGAAIRMLPVTKETGGAEETEGNDRLTVDNAVGQPSFSKNSRSFQLWNLAEQTPNPDSRLTLAFERDRLGLRQVELNWRLNALDKESIRKTQECIGMAVGASGHGRLKVELSSENLEWDPVPSGGHHHMGTTRMHSDARHGVVDADCKVHGVSNLYVAGSSVFPTGGFANPTLTIVAMAIRLADHVKQELNR